MANVLVLGAGGMLGSAMVKKLEKDGHKVTKTFRTAPWESDALRFQVGIDDLESLLKQIPRPDFVINCLGVLKKQIECGGLAAIAHAIEVNSLFPYSLAKQADQMGFKVIQIATDCVFDGSAGDYFEDSHHDATDIYGKSKSLGEVDSQNFMIIRTSIVGPEIGQQRSLYEWVRNLPQNSRIEGYVNHKWNGITSIAFSRIVSAIVSKDRFSDGVHHLIPADSVSKYQLVALLAETLGRKDLEIVQHFHVSQINRTLSSRNKIWSERTWIEAGYSSVPSIGQLIAELALKPELSSEKEGR
jgi:dTDP-4-dehydrorhamnose reductase